MSSDAKPWPGLRAELPEPEIGSTSDCMRCGFPIAFDGESWIHPLHEGARVDNHAGSPRTYRAPVDDRGARGVRVVRCTPATKIQISRLGVSAFVREEPVRIGHADE